MIKRQDMYFAPFPIKIQEKNTFRIHLEYCVSAWSPDYFKDKELLESVQHRFTRMFKDLRQRNYGGRLKSLNLWTL